MGKIYISISVYSYIVINQIQRNWQWRFTWFKFSKLWKLILCSFVLFSTRFSFVGKLRFQFMIFLPLCPFQVRVTVTRPCPVAEAKFSQDLANPSHFTVNVERKSKPSRLHLVLGLLEPIGSPGRGDPHMLCPPHSWGVARGWVILYLPPKLLETDRRAKEWIWKSTRGARR